MHITKFAKISAIVLLVIGHCSVRAQGQTARSKHAVALVPLVRCGSDGQLGPIQPSSGRSKAIAMSIPAEAAQHLAYYKAQIGVLAPRGWYCFGTYGSNGQTLYVSPDPINPADLFSTSWKGFAGPVVQISREDGDTSGRFGVAKTIARLFPARKAFVEGAIAEGIKSATSFPYGPYPADTLKYRNENIVEFLTPAQKDGLGTASRLQKSDTPISGVAILFGEEPNLLRLWLRLPSEISDFAQLIIQQTERGVSLFDK
jgi:hypothetical protein